MKVPHGHAFFLGDIEDGQEVAVTRKEGDVGDSSPEAQTGDVHTEQEIDRLLSYDRPSVCIGAEFLEAALPNIESRYPCNRSVVAWSAD